MNKKLTKLLDRQTARVEAFHNTSAKLVRPYAVELCKKIKKGIPEFEGFHMYCGTLSLEPSDLKIAYKCHVGTPDEGVGKERLENLRGYVPFSFYPDYQFALPSSVLTAIEDLQDLVHVIDERSNNIGDIAVEEHELE